MWSFVACLLEDGGEGGRDSLESNSVLIKQTKNKKKKAFHSLRIILGNMFILFRHIYFSKNT